MLSNSAFAGLLAAAYLTLLLTLLNPDVLLDGIGPILTAVALSYGAHTAVVFYALYAVRQITIFEPSPPGWISLRLLTWSAAVLSGATAVMTWLHAAGLQQSLDPRAVTGLERGTAAFGASAFAFLILGGAQLTTRHRRRTGVAILFTIVTIASIIVPLALRESVGGRPDPPLRVPVAVNVSPDTARRVILLCLDGASLDVISPAVAAGRLPNFGRLLERGSSMYLRTTRPTQPEPVWASVMTGMWPAKHGVRGAGRYRSFAGGPALTVLPDYLFWQVLLRVGLFVEEPYRAGTLAVQPLWEIVNAAGVRPGLIGLPLTHPAQAAEGFVVSDRFHRRADRVVTLDQEPSVAPARLDDLARSVLAAAPSSRELRVRLDLLPWTGESGSTVEADRLHHALIRELGAAAPVQWLAVRYAGLDAVGHYYLRYAQPEAFGNVSDEERRRFGRVLDDYYGYVDSLVGDAAASLRDDDLLLVVSGFGMEPLTLGKRVLERLVGDPRFSGTHERAPDGFLLAYGSAVAPGRQARGAVVDVAPTMLYFLGLPVARDMDGFARTDLFTPAFNQRHTITVIPTYGVHGVH
jgi:hypothetical protein